MDMMLYAKVSSLSGSAPLKRKHTHNSHHNEELFHAIAHMQNLTI